MPLFHKNLYGNINISMKFLNSRKKYYAIYTLLFLALSGTILYFYYSQGKTMIDFRGDGMRQHFRAILYYSDLLKKILGTLFTQGKLILPQWDLSIGEGGDILTTLHYYGVGDPISLLSVFCPDRYMYLFYDLSVFLKMYLAGIAFSSLAFYTKHENHFAVLSGTLLYAFSNFALINLSGHTIFLSSMIYLPLIILGVERSIANDRPYLLSLSVLLSSLSNLIFFYMNVLMTIVYVLVRLVFIKEEIKTRIQILFRIAAYSILGLFMSFIIFLPMAYAVFFNGRLSDSFNNSLFYTLSEYRLFFISFVFGYGQYYGNYSVIALLAVLRLFRNKSNITIKTLFIIGGIFLFLPFFGKLLNGMVYSTVRWVYGLALLIAYIVVHEFENLKQVDLVDTSVVIAYLSLCIYLNAEFNKIYIMFALLALAYYISLKLKTTNKIFKLSALSIIIFSIFFSILYRYSPLWWNYTNLGTDINKLRSVIYPDTDLLKQIKDDDVWRYSGDSITTNSALNSHYYATDFYWSVANNDVVEFRKQLGLLDHNNHHYDNYDSRFALNALSDIRYYIKKEGETVPYGYHLLEKIDEKSLYESDHSLPLIYAYDKELSYSDWQNLNVIEKAEALTQSAIMDETEQKNNISLTSKAIPYTLNCENLTIKDGMIETNSDDAVLKLAIESEEKGEYYLLLEGFDTSESINLYVNCLNDVRKAILFKSENHTGNADKHDFAVNLGYSDGIKEEITISIPAKGKYVYKNISIICQPLDQQISDIEELKDSLQIDTLDYKDNTLHAKIFSDANKTLCIAMPYTKGWKAFDNAKQIPIKKVNGMYMGFNIEEGNHEVLLQYQTPLLKQGTLISAIASIIYLASIIWPLKKQKH